jgi:oligopeptidase A
MNTIQYNKSKITPSKVVCVGRNYVEHIKELNNETPDSMVLFNKPNSAITDTLYFISEDTRFEGEICFIIENNQINGVGFGLDLTKANIQNKMKQKGLPWERAKAFNNSAVFSKFVNFDDDITKLKLELFINDKLVQFATYDLMIYKPSEIIEEIQTFLTLEDGDIIMSGTPKGVGTYNLGDKFEGKIYCDDKLLICQTWEATQQKEELFESFVLDDFENSPKKIAQLIEENKTKLKELLLIQDKTYDNFMVPYEIMSEKFNETITPIFHIDNVKNSKITQKVFDESIPLISIYTSQLSSNEELFDAILNIYKKEKNSLDNEQIKVLENEIRDFKLGGCGLNDKDKKTLEEINLKLSELSKEFSQNLLDATNSWEMIIDNFKDVKDVPKSDLENAKFTDEKDGKVKYKFTLQMPSYIAYITYGTNRAKREEIYKAYCTKAPKNGKLIEQILSLKKQEANLLGFDNYAKLSLATKMANKEDEVIEFLEQLAFYSKPKAQKELEEVKQLAKKDGCDDLASFDLAFYSQKLKEEKYDIDEEYYRPYFEKNSVINGLFEFLNKIFDLDFIKTDTPTWDKKVQVYEIFENSKKIARIYIDLEARDNKKGGAWMNNWHTHSQLDGKYTLPTAYVVCNFPASSDTLPSLLRHSDVVTLFHEMGHALHHLLSKVKQPFVSGINGVAWDTVEFPSQFLEYFAYEKEVLQLFAKHYKTKQILDDKSIQKLIKAKNFQSSLATIRQVEFALFDFKLHQKLYDEQGTQELLDNIRDEISVIIPPKYNKFQNGFSHIFAGGYSAGYYSYKWAEVLSADAFYMFINNGIFNKTLANSYKNLILSKGGSVDMDKLFYEFTNKKPDIKSLLKIDGIIS